MEQKHLKRAQEIVEGIAHCKNALSFDSPAYSVSNMLELQKPNQHGYTTPETARFQMSRSVRDIAFKALRRELELRLAALRREAAQIGLVLED
ncbi:MAG: hypothetical protein ACOVQ0_16390 [Novosphingobium sp.]|uniref:hypothetical protein n=1 Tax=Novosphingobium sp. TaxID=1874826 RepID=UPI003B9A36E7